MSWNELRARHLRRGAHHGDGAPDHRHGGVLLLADGVSAVPALLIDWMSAISENPIIILLLINYPAAGARHLHGHGADDHHLPRRSSCRWRRPTASIPVHFGVIMILNFGIGLNTPPVGAVQFVACAVGKITVWEAMRSIWPFYGGRTRGARPRHLHPGASRSGCPACSDRRGTWPRPSLTFRIERKPKLSERVVTALRAQVLSRRDSAGPENADREPADRNLRREPHGDPRGDRHACGRRAGRGAPGRRRLRARPSHARLRLDQPRHRQQDLAGASTCSKCAWASRSKAPGSRRSGATVRRRPQIQEAFFEFERLLDIGQATGKTDFAFHRAIAAATNNPFYVEVLDALGDAHDSLRHHLALGHRQRADARIPGRAAARASRHPECDFGERSAGGARCHARASDRQPGALPPAAARPAGRICLRA